MAGARVVVAGAADGAFAGELDARVRRWALAVTGDADSVVVDAAVGERVSRLFDGGPGPVLVARPVLPAWPDGLADAALGDLADGCDVSLGPLFDGGCYLVAFARPVPALLSLGDRLLGDLDPIGLAVRAAASEPRGVPFGLLRTERGLRNESDARALLADPLLDSELRRLLR